MFGHGTQDHTPMARLATTRGEAMSGSALSVAQMAALQSSLQALVQEVGARREEERSRQQQHEAEARELAAASSSPRKHSAAYFAADLVLREEETGFELWIGSLEDALNLRALHERGISAVLNCAVEDCQAECACFRPTRSARPRCHTRNQSMEEGTLGSGWIGLQRDQIWSLASFDADWYSDVLECEVSYSALPAKDEAGYEMCQHFSEVIEFLSGARRSGQKVLVHCVMGINRSVAASVAFLTEGMGMPLKAAVALTAERRGCVLSNNSFLDQLITSFADPKGDSFEEVRNSAALKVVL
ncbi:unnamed protein product [Polarella glacialis]|uniref:protein-tyrosine-phosphatase n=1 Tax=Polarella glacialis TaxID=89957 RepID=A0A813HR78_POLGL|nr:unnamed protein product [Polarella glacialis]